MAGSKENVSRIRVWPAAALPLGLTLLLTVAAWQFNAKVAADQAYADADNARRESYARQEAGKIARHAKSLAAAFVEGKLSARRAQEKNLHLEAKGILDSVHRMLIASLDAVRKNALVRREVRPFPAGFDGPRVFLEVAPSDEATDEALAALRASHTELASLLPAGCSLAVIEDNSRQLYSLGGGVPPGDAVHGSAATQMIFNDGGKTRLWTIRLTVASSDSHPLPGAAETAEYIALNLKDMRLAETAWQGWLLGKKGEVAAVFGPASASGSGGASPEAPPYTGRAGEWVDIDGSRLVWLEKAGRGIADLEWEPAAAVAMPRPSPPLDLVEEFFADTRWSVTLGVLLALVMFGWVWFVRTLFSGRGDAAPAVSAASSGRGKVESPQLAKRRLVRDGNASRAIPDVQGVIVADIGDDGKVRLEEAFFGGAEARQPVPPPSPKPKIPAGSLFRLQAIHRGREGLRSSRVLDHAKSQVLRELAGRVRPVVEGSPLPPRPGKPAGAQTEIIPGMKSAKGWKRVEE